MIRTIITAITGGPKEWWVIRWNSQYWSTQRAPDMFPEASVIRDRLTRRAALRLARRLRQQAEDRPEAVL